MFQILDLFIASSVGLAMLVGDQMKTDNAPRWLAQVLNRIERVAKTDAVASAFVTTSSQQLADARVLLGGGVVAVKSTGSKEMKNQGKIK